MQLFTIANEIVSWPEALFFLLTYALYIVAMAFNANIEEVAKAKLPVPASWDQVRLVGFMEELKLHLRLIKTEQISPRHWNCTPPSMRYMYYTGAFLLPILLTNIFKTHKFALGYIAVVDP